MGVLLVSQFPVFAKRFALSLTVIAWRELCEGHRWCPSEARRAGASAASLAVGKGVQVHPHPWVHSRSRVRGPSQMYTATTFFSPLQDLCPLTARVGYIELYLSGQGGVCPGVPLGSGKLELWVMSSEYEEVTTDGGWRWEILTLRGQQQEERKMIWEVEW